MTHVCVIGAGATGISSAELPAVRSRVEIHPGLL